MELSTVLNGTVAHSPSTVDGGAGGDLFGLALAGHDRGMLFLDDGDNTLKLFGRS